MSLHATAGARLARALPGVPGRSSAACRRRRAAGLSVPIPERTSRYDTSRNRRFDADFVRDRRATPVSADSGKLQLFSPFWEKWEITLFPPPTFPTFPTIYFPTFGAAIIKSITFPAHVF